MLATLESVHNASLDLSRPFVVLLVNKIMLFGVCHMPPSPTDSPECFHPQDTIVMDQMNTQTQKSTFTSPPTS